MGMMAVPMMLHPLTTAQNSPPLFGYLVRPANPTFVNAPPIIHPHRIPHHPPPPTNTTTTTINNPNDHHHHHVDKSEIICKFWALGYCGKGDQCPYLHSRSGIASPGQDYKAKLRCRNDVASRKADLASLPGFVPGFIYRMPDPLESVSFAGARPAARIPITDTIFPSQGVSKPVNIPVVWSPPPPGWIKINTDGAVRGSTTGASSCGGVFRDSRGAVLGAFSSFIGTDSTPLEAEMHGVRLAIDMASSIGLQRVWLESDSTQIVNMLKNSATDVPPRLRGEWGETLKKIEGMECFRVSHTYREGNTVADKLANHGIESRDGLTVWREQPPDFILREAQLDASGHTYFRLKA